MASNPNYHQKWAVEEYLAYEDETDIRHEYIDGEIYAMSGGTENHSGICANGIAELGNQTRGKPCRVHASDMKVKVSETKYLYPDFSVVCGEAQFADEKRTLLTNPILMAEVISDSSEKYDKITKNEYYRSLSSLKYYLIIDQSRVHVQLYTVQGEGWLLQEFTRREQSISLDAIDVTLSLSELYLDVEFDDTSVDE
jgi:Uma2 family endonuclease